MPSSRYIIFGCMSEANKSLLENLSTKEKMMGDLVYHR